jgi:hypothetical protein
MSNEQILHFAHMEVPEACRECIIRDVMTVDQIEYDEVRLRLFKFAEQKCVLTYHLRHGDSTIILKRQRRYSTK